MTLDYETIGQRIKKQRVSQNLTQEDVADKIDTSVAFYSRLERGTSHVNLKRLVQLGEILGTSAGYFLTGINEGSENYLNSEFKDILDKCTPKQQKFIYKVAELVAEGF